MLHKKHNFYKTFKKLIIEINNHQPIYDLGTPSRFHKEMGLVKDLVSNDNYFAGGFNPDFSLGRDSCDFHCDIENLSQVESNTIGSVVCLSVLEHVKRPEVAIKEIYRILKPGGKLLISTPFMYTYHGKSENYHKSEINKIALYKDFAHNNYPDFRRYTHEGLASLCFDSGFAKCSIYPQDGWLISRLEVIGIYHMIRKINIINMLINYFDKPRIGRMTTMHFALATKAL